MHRAVRKTAAVLLASGAFTFVVSVPAGAQIAFTPCGESNELACGHLTVALDPAGGSPGTLTLAIRRHRAPVGEERSAVIALAGGPGQAALPFTEQFTSLLGPILATRDLIVFDQRGTGLSHPLSCHRFEPATGNGPAGPAVAECAAQIGLARSFYTTDYSAADLEAIRIAGGYEKLVLYGTSYGTKLAEEYAQEHPSHVEALVLDSVVSPNGPDPLNLSTFAAVPRILRELCAQRACEHISRNPVADLGDLVKRLGKHDRRARWIDGHGHPRTIGVSSQELIEALVEGDLESGLRAEFPAAVRSAAHGDLAALARLLERARTSEGSETESPGESFDGPLYFATTCEEGLFPWSRANSPSGRLAEASAQIRALPTRAIAPFTQDDVRGLSDIPACAYWPFTTSAPARHDARLPSVPTLILSGADDLRTPTANAREVADAIPGSRLLVLPNVGHSVLGQDPTHCATNALQALFADKPIKPCPPSPPPALLRPTPLPPPRLADVAPARGNHGRPGRTLTAVLETIGDSERQLALQIAAQLSGGKGAAAFAASVGGLRSGWAGFVAGRLVLHDYSYVPGVTVSGEITTQRIELTVAGAAAARGALRGNAEATASQGSLSGRLEGQQVNARGGRPGVGSAASALQATVAEVRAKAGLALR